MSLREQLAEMREEILRITNKHGATRVRVFGSVARGDEHAESDVDFLVEFEQGRSLMDHAALVMELEELLNRKVEIASERGLKPKYRQRILNEALPL